jgi:2-aminoadipate transaminase
MSLDSLIREGAASSNVIQLGGGLPAPELFPRKRLTDAFMHSMRDPTCAALQYDWPEGQGFLREWVAQRLRLRGAGIDRSDVIITAGAQQGIVLASHHLLPAGARVRVAAESYPPALALFRRRNARIVVDGEASDCAYFMDGIGNPRGLIPDARIRARLIQEGLPLIVDEAYADLSFDGSRLRPLLADAPERVWHIGSLSKTLCPGLRIGWLVPPRCMLESTRELKFTMDLQSSTLSQVVVEHYLASEDFEGRLAHARDFYQRRAEVLSTAMRRRLPEWRFAEPSGGFALFAETEYQAEHPDADEEWLRTAMEHGVAFDPGSLFGVRPNPTTLGMRLCFSATKVPDLLEAVKRLESAWRALRSKRAGVLRSSSSITTAEAS